MHVCRVCGLCKLIFCAGKLERFNYSPTIGCSWGLDWGPRAQEALIKGWGSGGEGGNAALAGYTVTGLYGRPVSHAAATVYLLLPSPPANLGAGLRDRLIGLSRL